MIATGSRIIVKKLQSAMTSSGGIILQNPTDRPQVQVVACGPRVTSDIQPGDDLVLDWSRVGRFEFLEQEYFVVDESDVWCVVE